MYNQRTQQILREINSVLSTVDPAAVDDLISAILQARVVVVAGAGRVGLAAAGFAMRLGHLGLRAYTLGDSTVPGVGPGDLLLVASGSGETQTVYDVARAGKNAGARIALVTGRVDSRLACMADLVVLMQAPTKLSSGDIESIQPLTTLNEQSLQLLFDTTVLLLMDRTRETNDSMWSRHSSLE